MTEAEQKAAAEAKAAADKAAADKVAADAKAAAGASGGAGDAGGKKDDPPPDLTKTGFYMPPGAIKRLKEAEREKGRAAFKAELDAKAQAKGFKDFDSWLDHDARAAAAAGEAAAKGKKVEKPDKKGDDDKEDKDEDRDDKRGNSSKLARRLAAEVEKERRERQKSDRRLREAEQRLEARDARARLERQFILDGVKDVDYAISLLERETATMTVEEAEKFDERAWLTKLRGDRPYLFGERVAPIDTTGTKGGGGGDAGAGAGGGKVDQPGSGKPIPGKANAAMEVDPKTGKYVLSEREKQSMLADILRTANQPGPVMQPKN